MGSDTGMWLLYRAGDGSLAFSVLVLGSGRETPVHDHLAWGLVGLYRGTQDEVVYRRQDDGTRDDYAELVIAEHNALTPGDFYTLLPQNDIHRVRTTSAMTSVSLHLLGNDNGCIARRQYVPEEKQARPFRSGYLNVPCADGDGRGTPTWDEVHASVRRLAAG
jgi:predicted metal-dependent enzyme (double-stranded beta helix superfamily)